MHKLSTILLAKKRGPRNFIDEGLGRSSHSLEEGRRSFNRETLRNGD